MDGLSDLLSRAADCSVFGIGCNRARVEYEFWRYGATTLHGCDIYDKGMLVAGEWFADLRGIDARFEVVDLTQGAKAVEAAFGEHLLPRYDFMLMFAVYHKLEREMPKPDLLALVDYFIQHTAKYFVWRGSWAEKKDFERLLDRAGFELVHWSQISVIEFDGKPTRQPCAVWERKNG